MYVLPEKIDRAIDNSLCEASGMMMKRRIPWMCCLGFGEVPAPYFTRNKYEYSVIQAPPGDPRDLSRMGNPTWKGVEALELTLIGQEEITLASLCCHNLRPMSIHFQTPSSGVDSFFTVRHSTCGDGLCYPLQPLELFSNDKINDAPRLVGRIRDDHCDHIWERLNCMYITDIETRSSHKKFKRAYSIRVNKGCSGGTVQNFCAPSCFRGDAVYDILNARGKVVAHLQERFNPECISVSPFSTYLLAFPDGSGVDERALLVAALLSIEMRTPSGRTVC
ncbi:unnamed protein product [Discosporangium mesarthrocarpum]